MKILKLVTFSLGNKIRDLPLCIYNGVHLRMCILLKPCFLYKGASCKLLLYFIDDFVVSRGWVDIKTWTWLCCGTDIGKFAVRLLDIGVDHPGEYQGPRTIAGELQWVTWRKQQNNARSELGRPCVCCLSFQMHLRLEETPEGGWR